MKKKTAALITEDNLLVDFTLHRVPISLLTEFCEKIVRPYYGGNMKAAIYDLLQKAIVEQDFILSHMTHAKKAETKSSG